MQNVLDFIRVFSSEKIGIGSSLGMLIGLAVGSGRKKQ